MKRTIIAAAAMAMAIAAAAQEPVQDNQNLEVVFDGCQPLKVLSKDSSCGNGADPVNEACRPDNGPVRWVPLDSIKEITTKDNSQGGLHNCMAKPEQGYYQCIVRGNVGDVVSYNVISTGDCKLDPVIRIRQ